ncbi:hypothetical protein E1A91_A12G146500v1, partial [Gossypium mustelinum]
KLSTRNLDGFDIRFLHFLLRNSYCKNPIIHGSFHLIHLHVLRQPEPPHELPTATFKPVPGVVLVFLLHIPLTTDLKHPIVFNLHFHFLFLEAREVSLEHMGFRGFFPVHPGAQKSRAFRVTSCE